MRIGVVIVIAVGAAGCWSSSSPAPAPAASAPRAAAVPRKAPKCGDAGDGDGDEGREAMLRFCKYVERVCACAGAGCVTSDTETYGREMASWDLGNAARSPNEDVKRAVEVLVRELGDCNQRLAQKGIAP